MKLQNTRFNENISYQYHDYDADEPEQVRVWVIVPNAGKPKVVWNSPGWFMNAELAEDFVAQIQAIQLVENCNFVGAWKRATGAVEMRTNLTPETIWAAQRLPTKLITSNPRRPARNNREAA